MDELLSFTLRVYELCFMSRSEANHPCLNRFSGFSMVHHYTTEMFLCKAKEMLNTPMIYS